jgi:hypothetical protein
MREPDMNVFLSIARASEQGLPNSVGKPTLPDERMRGVDCRILQRPLVWDRFLLRVSGSAWGGL